MKQANHTWLDAVKYARQNLTADDLEEMSTLADSVPELETRCENNEAWANDLQLERDELKTALKAILLMDVKGHDLADRLQFSDSGRAILAQALAALQGEF